MHNLLYLIGRTTKEVEVEETEDGGKRSKMNLAVSRAYKNEDGIYETDFIDVILLNGMAEKVAEYCQKGDLVGVKGRLQTDIIDDKKEYYVIADKISFLTSNKKDEE